MSTRHLQTVINENGMIKINQYGQWDGYPSGQGVEILKFLRDNDLELYLKKVNELREAIDEDFLKADRSKNWEKLYPQLNRDTGSKIHNLILKGKVKFVDLATYNDARLNCSGFYTINFQHNIFVAEYGGNIKSYELTNLPSDEQFLKDFKEGK